ncbi:MAG: TetR/AcrR family transcriptional regulator [Cyanobacteria bacterium P01_F01_bin.153]
MKKSQITRQRIIEQAAKLLNRQGFAGVSMSELMAATGLQKGGIYNHFASKDELVVAAFRHSVTMASRRQIVALRGHRRGDNRLKAFVASFVGSFEEISEFGGCPLMNTAIDSDDTHPALREQAQQAMGQWRSTIERIVQRGIDRGEFMPQTQPPLVATILISVLEGALALGRLEDDPTPMHHAQTHLEAYIDSLTIHAD